MNVMYCLHLQLLFKMADFTHTTTTIDTKRVQLDTGAKYKVTTGTEPTAIAFRYCQCEVTCELQRQPNLLSMTCLLQRLSNLLSMTCLLQRQPIFCTHGCRPVYCRDGQSSVDVNLFTAETAQSSVDETLNYIDLFIPASFLP